MASDTILIWGAGAIGGTLGAYWTRARHPVLMVDIVAEHAEACSTTGLSIEGPVESFSQVVPCVTPDHLSGQFSRVVLAVKAQATEEAVKAILPHLAAEGVILSAQNGLNERTIAALAGPERTLGAFVNFGADWLGPGKVLYGNRGAVVVGELDGAIRSRTTGFHDLLRIFEPDAVLTPDIWSYLWGKMGYVAMLFATALNQDSMSANFANPGRNAAFIAIGREVMLTARAEGIKPRGFNGFEPEAFMPDASYEDARQCLNALAVFNAKTAKTHSGIYRDLAVRKRRTEVDQMVSVTADIAAGHGIETPVLRRLAELIRDVEEGRRVMSPETFDALNDALTP